MLTFFWWVGFIIFLFAIATQNYRYIAISIVLWLIVIFNGMVMR